MSEAAPARRLCLIELNEFSVSLLRRGVEALRLPHVAHLLSMRASATTTDDAVEHRGLDPWVQWVSVHTGVPASVHGVRHLGEAPLRLQYPQLWEILSTQGISSGVWGAMNAGRGNAERCRFFLPDPWSVAEPAHPRALNRLLALPRYYARNYLEVSAPAVLRGVLGFAQFVVGSGSVLRLLRQLPFALGGLRRAGANNALLFALFDLINCVLFTRFKRHHAPQFSLIFLNSLAHLQHHRWSAVGPPGQALAFGLRAIDRCLGLLFAALAEGEAVLVMNALTQRNIVGETPRICYRQISPTRFLESIGLGCRQVQQLMTNDAHVDFDSPAQRDAAAAALARAQIAGAALFQVEVRADELCRLFYQVDCWDELADECEVEINGRRIRFFDHFEAIVARTGAHVPAGDCFACGIELPPQLYNHEVAGHVLGYFGIDCPVASSGAPAGGVPATEDFPIPSQAASSVCVE
jgi:hypothetical protein